MGCDAAAFVGAGFAYTEREVVFGGEGEGGGEIVGEGLDCEDV